MPPDGEILGFHILAPHGDDLLHEAMAAMHDNGGIERTENRFTLIRL